MQSDLNQPLGKDQKSKPSQISKKPAKPHKWLAGFAVAAILAGTSYAAFVKDPLQKLAVVEIKPDIVSINKSSTPDTNTGIDGSASQKPGQAIGQSIGQATGQNQQTQSDIIGNQAGNSGGQINTVTTPNGLKVTTITPDQRASDNPVILNPPNRRGQDSRLAHLPNPSIIENTPSGRLPIYGQNGQRAFDIYARPWSGARGVRIAILVGGLGLSQTGSNYAIENLPEDITLGFAGNGNSLQRWMQTARREGHEIILQVPLEPFDYPNNNPGRGTLVTANDPVSNIKSLHDAMGRITNYAGISNFMGGRFLSAPESFEPIMRDIAKRGIMFFDDGSSAQSLAETFSRTLGIPFAAGDIILDGKQDKGSILQKLDDLERVARRNGQAIGVASAFPESVDAIAQWSNEAKARGIEIVGLSALATDPERR
jgi:polysaccharide deacetylase 2 family uncharacterized protein YibQ